MEERDDVDGVSREYVQKRGESESCKIQHRPSSEQRSSPAYLLASFLLVLLLILLTRISGR